MRDLWKDSLVYAVTDRSWLRGQSLAEQVEAAILGGATLVQFREKELVGEEREAAALEVQRVCKKHGIPFIVNDDVELAVRIGADGVHVGQKDMEAGLVRQMVGPDRIIGVTAKTVEQARAARDAGADYLGSGAVFGSATKKDAKPMSLAQFAEICASVDIPVVAIGGITEENMEKLSGCGMAGFAIVSGIFAAEDIEGTTRRIREKAEKMVKPRNACAKAEKLVKPQVGCPEIPVCPGESICAEEPVCPGELRDHFRTLVAEKRPVIQCITNIVTVNDCANALLAVGASPTMAHHPQEMADFAKICDGLVCNMGATESLEAMQIAAETAARMGHPIVIDPVGCAGSPFRRERCLALIRVAHPACIRGNSAEIRALAEHSNTGRGVDVEQNDAEKNDPDGYESLKAAARALSEETGAIVIATGTVDLLVYRDRYYEVHAGSPWMTRITGSGCMLSSLLGAFLAAENTLESAWACCTWMAQCGEQAQQETESLGAGTGTYHIKLIDALSQS